MAAVARLGARYWFVDDNDYPPLLAELENAPPALIIRGERALAGGTVIAMVGARNASAAACRFARGLAAELGQAIASGIDIAFPPENAQLQEEVARQGLLIAEQPPGAEPLARHFPSRNRIIAGLALGTVVVEAAPRSGSLITARIAAEAGREVMAVPGSPLDPRAQGCNLLIREGATLVQSAADILEAVRPIGPRAVRSPSHPFDPGPATDPTDAERRAVAGLLGPVPVAVDELVRQSGLAPGIVQTLLLKLELAGRLERHAGNCVSIRPL